MVCPGLSQAVFFSLCEVEAGGTKKLCLPQTSERRSGEAGRRGLLPGLGGFIRPLRDGQVRPAAEVSYLF